MVIGGARARTRKRLAWAPLALALALFTRQAKADDAEQQRTAAKVLFEQGLACGERPCACSNFEASARLFERASTLVKVAICRRLAKNYVAAWQALERAREVNQQDTSGFRADLETEIEQELTRLPSLKLSFDSAPVGLEVRIDGVETLPERRAVGVELGAHEVSASAPGFVPFKRVVTVTEPREYAVIVELSPLPEPEPPPPLGVQGGSAGSPSSATAQPAPPLAAGADAPTPAADASSAGSTQRIAGFVLGGVGLIGLGVAGYLGLHTLDLVDQSSPYCDGNGNCHDPKGKSLRDEAGRTQTAGFITAGVGLAALAGGILLVVAAPEPPAARERAQAQQRWTWGVASSGLWGQLSW